MNALLFAVPATLVLLCWGCGSDDDILSPDGQSAAADNGDSAVVGDLTGMQLIQGNTALTLMGMYDVATAHFDIDGDGDQDLRLGFFRESTLGMGLRTWAWLLPLDTGLALGGSHATDTTFIRTEVDTMNPGSQWTVEIRTTTHFNCSPMPGATDSSFSPDRPQLERYISGEWLSADQNFITDSINLFAGPLQYTSTLGMIGLSNDTATTVQSTFTRDCNYPSFGSPTYVGFRINGANGPRVGWLLFTIVDESSILIHQVVVQP